ncbi:MAG: GNAT family N-acetyltransferase [Asticcacaulis sp.]|jgi:predicted GNAT family acetyltransferase|uniref:GNAT family N-acetyltransferase n=1 Tax=Asticcacaulis sp. TaxID=1872648 RepID=UPI003F7C90B5
MITDNTDKRRFELHENGHTAYADYRRDNDSLYIDYVEAPPVLRGTGAAGRLMEGVMQSARANNLKVIPICGYAAAWIKRHPGA